LKVRVESCEYFVTKICFHGELLAPCPTPKLEDHPLLAVCDCLFNIFAATLHIGGCSYIRNLRTRNVVVIGSHLSLITGEWRKLHNEELNDLCSSGDKIKKNEMGGACSTYEEWRGVYRVLVGIFRERNYCGAQSWIGG
jgi:hypothetical protein